MKNKDKNKMELVKFALSYRKNNKDPKDGYYRWSVTGKKKLVKSSKDKADIYIEFNPEHSSMKVTVL